MLKKRKWFMVGLALVMMMSLVLGCGLAKKDSGGGNASGKEGNASGKEAPKTVTLKFSHQWPGGTATEGDFRSQLAMKFASEVEKRTKGQLKFEIYPNESLVKATQQYDAMMKGALDFTIYPLDYVGGKIPQLSITLMPALVKDHKQAMAWQKAEIGKKIEEITEKNGVKILVWVWNAGAIGAKGNPVVAPEDVRPGMTMRAAGKLVESMLKSAGAGISSLPSSEIYTALQTKVLDAAITSNSSFGSYKLYEQVDSYTTSLKNTFWFMFEPLLVSNDTWNKLTPEQQKIITEVSAELQPWAYQASKDDDIAVTKIFKEKGVKVVDMDDAAFAKWEKLAQPVWAKYEKDVPGGKELMDLAKKVK